MPGGKLPDEAAGIAAVIGVVSHLCVYRFSPEGIDHRNFFRFGIAATCVVTSMYCLPYFGIQLIGLSAGELQSRTQALVKWGMFLPVLVVSILVVYMAFRLIQIKFHPANRISRLIAVGDFDEAIRIGVKQLTKKWDFGTSINLAHAYVRAGKPDKAREIIAELERESCVSKFCTQEVFTQAINMLKASIEKASTGTS